MSAHDQDSSNWPSADADSKVTSEYIGRRRPTLHA